MKNRLLRVLWKPESFFAIQPVEMDLVIREARRTLLLAHLAHRLSGLAGYDRVPEPVREHFTAAGVVSDVYERMLGWETEQLRLVLNRADIVPILLKGAAYRLAGLPMAEGRITSDVDILIPDERLPETEAALREAGWVEVKTDEYDQNYYRQWMHELPPLRHRLRGTDVDVHHSILPRTARLKPDPASLIAAALPVGDGGLRVLCPEDTVLHKVVHHFYQGEFDNSLRELVDLDGLLKAYAGESGFWGRLVPRAAELDLLRPLYYGLRYTTKLLHTPIPPEVIAASRKGRPNPLAGLLMDLLAPYALLPDHPERRNRLKRAVRWLLYLRSHWIRMPPLLLARHLATKARMRRRQRSIARSAKGLGNK